MRYLRQVYAVTALSMQSLPQRLGPASVIVVGIAAVVAVLLGMLTLADSLKRAATATGRADRALVLSQGAGFEYASAIPHDFVATIQGAPGVRKTPAGEAIASAEVLGGVTLRERLDNSRAHVTLRGLEPISFVLRPEVRLVAGRMLTPGMQELLVGKSAQARYQGLDVGDEVRIRATPWRVVGAFEAGGSLRESEIIVDAKTLLSVFQRSAFQSVVVQLESPGSFATFKDFLTSNPQLAVDVISEPDYGQRVAGSLTSLLQLVAYMVGGIMAAAATFGAINTMYSAVSDRGKEIATLRAVGFGSGEVTISVLTEALTLALVGAAIGTALVAVILNGVSYHSGAINSQLHVTAGLVAVGALWACGIGALGGLLPAWRIVRMPVATALREI